MPLTLKGKYKYKEIIIIIIIIIIGIMAILIRDVKFRINNYATWKNERINFNFELKTINYVTNKYKIKMPFLIYQNYDPGSRILVKGYHMYPDSNIVIFMNADFDSKKKYELVKCQIISNICNLGIKNINENFEKNEHFLKVNHIDYHYRDTHLKINKIELLEVIKAENSGYNVVAKVLK